MFRSNQLVFVVAFTTFCFSSPCWSFQDKFALPEPEDCPDHKLICGDDPSKYPADKIDKIVRQSIELKIAPETMDRFFGPFRPSERRDPVDPVTGQYLETTCDIRNETLPRFPRMRNVLGELVYLAEGENHKQYVVLTYCAQKDLPCKNDLDSPHGQGTTACSQLYRTQKLLAVNKNSEMIVDTFMFPSACVCKYKNFEFGSSRHLRSASYDSLLINQAPVCTAKVASKKLKTFETGKADLIPRSDRMRIDRMSSKISPCEKDAVLCETGDDAYPESTIKKVLSTHVAFKTPTFFDKLFGDVCVPQDDFVSTRGGFDVSLTGLCSSGEKYIYPKRAKVGREWFYIINTDQYRQGVMTEECLKYSKGNPCLYGGSEGVNPEIRTTCIQLFSVQFLLAVSGNGTVIYEGFQVPTACSCFSQEKTW